MVLRAFEPVEGEARMRALRGLKPQALAREIGSGPGKLCQALDITLDDYGTSLLRGRFTLRRPSAIAAPDKNGVGQREKEEVLFFFYDMKDEIVHV